MAERNRNGRKTSASPEALRQQLARDLDELLRLGYKYSDGDKEARKDYVELQEGIEVKAAIAKGMERKATEQPGRDSDQVGNSAS